MAAQAACVTFLATNASPAMAPVGRRKKTLAATPWSWAAPAGKHAPIVLDIANTSVAPGANVIRCELPARQASAQGACKKAGTLDFEGY
jgi:LDH2 family malate/lactate/ureidoglycolate dehydrogenase